MQQLWTGEDGSTSGGSHITPEQKSLALLIYENERVFYLSAPYLPNACVVFAVERILALGARGHMSILLTPSKVVPFDQRS